MDFWIVFHSHKCIDSICFFYWTILEKKFTPFLRFFFFNLWLVLKLKVTFSYRFLFYLAFNFFCSLHLLFFPLVPVASQLITRPPPISPLPCLTVRRPVPAHRLHCLPHDARHPLWRCPLPAPPAGCPPTSTDRSAQPRPRSGLLPSSPPPVHEHEHELHGLLPQVSGIPTSLLYCWCCFHCWVISLNEWKSCCISHLLPLLLSQRFT